MQLHLDVWEVSGVSVANTEKEHSQAAPSSSDRQHIITEFSAIITAAVTGDDALVSLEDANDNILWRDYFGASAARGTRIGMVFRNGIPVPIGVGCKIVTAAGGASVVIAANMAGYER